MSIVIVDENIKDEEVDYWKNYLTTLELFNKITRSKDIYNQLNSISAHIFILLYCYVIKNEINNKLETEIHALVFFKGNDVLNICNECSLNHLCNNNEICNRGKFKIYNYNKYFILLNEEEVFKLLQTYPNI